MKRILQASILMSIFLLQSCNTVILSVTDNYCIAGEDKPDYIKNVPVQIHHKLYYDGDRIALYKGIHKVNPLPADSLYVIGYATYIIVPTDSIIEVVLEVVD